jgi:hypothetical protein
MSVSHDEALTAAKWALDQPDRKQLLYGYNSRVTNVGTDSYPRRNCDAANEWIVGVWEGRRGEVQER